MGNVLVIAPHPDDEILGCGGTMLKHIAEGDNVYVCIVTHAAPPIYKEGASANIQKAAKQCHNMMGVKETFFLNFPTVMLETVDRYKINDAILNVEQSTKADVMYIPHYGDMQKDHQIVADACMVAARPKYKHRVLKVYGYETMSETAWNAPNVQNEFIPNTYVDISDFLEKKKEALSFYGSQLNPFPDARSLESIDALAKYRGALMHMNAAEAFMLLRELR
ncbi:MAG: PIG-L family deacetylase [Bacteroidales bacterium]|nr:PIG-L family deacetylase [Bacteroidales bacterium]